MIFTPFYHYKTKVKKSKGDFEKNLTFCIEKHIFSQLKKIRFYITIMIGREHLCFGVQKTKI